MSGLATSPSASTPERKADPIKVQVSVPEVVLEKLHEVPTGALYRISTYFEDTLHVENSFTSEVTRSPGQVTWLRFKLASSYPAYVIPSSPEPPSLSQLREPDYLEKKRRQVERFLKKVCARRETVDHPDTKLFLLQSATPIPDSIDSLKPSPVVNAVSSFLNAVAGPIMEKGLRVYKPITAPVRAIANEAEFITRKERALLMEKGLADTLEAFGKFVLTTHATARLQLDYGEALSALASDVKSRVSQPGPGPLVVPAGKTPSARAVANHQRLVAEARVVLAALNRFEVLGRRYRAYFKEAFEVQHTQIKSVIYDFGDVLLEQKNTIEPIKSVLNFRTDLLEEYDQSSRDLLGAKKASELSRRKYGSGSTEARGALVAEREIEERAHTIKERYARFSRVATRELSGYEETRSKELMEAVRKLARTFLETERDRFQKLKELERAFKESTDVVRRDKKGVVFSAARLANPDTKNMEDSGEDGHGSHHHSKGENGHGHGHSHGAASHEHGEDGHGHGRGGVDESRGRTNTGSTNSSVDLVWSTSPGDRPGYMDEHEGAWGS